MVWSGITNVAMEASTSNKPEHDTEKYLGASKNGGSLLLACIPLKYCIILVAGAPQIGTFFLETPYGAGQKQRFVTGLGPTLAT